MIRSTESWVLWGAGSDGELAVMESYFRHGCYGELLRYVCDGYLLRTGCDGELGVLENWV